MKVRELNPEGVKIGLRIKSLAANEKVGTVVRIERNRDNLTWVLWDGEWQLRSAFYSNECECEVVEDK